MREWMIRHPQAVAFVFTVCAVVVAANAFDAGQRIGAARVLLGDADRLASEALGG